MNQPAREYMRGRCLEEAAMLRDGKPCLSIPVTPIELLSLLDEADDRDRLLADLAKAREELEALKAEYQCAECQAVTRERDEARSGSEAYSRLLATSEKALGETAAQLAALEARAADARTCAEYIAAGKLNTADETWRAIEAARRYLTDDEREFLYGPGHAAYSNAPAAPAKAVSVREHARNRGTLDGTDAQALEGALAATERERDNLLARIHRDGGHYVAQHGAPKAVADADKIVATLHGERGELAAQLAEAVDLLRGMEGRLPLSHPGRPRLDAFFAAIDAGRARAT